LGVKSNARQNSTLKGISNDSIGILKNINAKFVPDLCAAGETYKSIWPFIQGKNSSNVYNVAYFLGKGVFCRFITGNFIQIYQI
jgi:hypothetical protein